MSPCYTAGYSWHAPKDLQTVAMASGALLCDIRYKPYSPRPEWQQAALQASWGQEYIWLPEFGNCARFSRDPSAPIEIADYAAGKARLLAILATRPAILFCACHHIEKCHRGVLALDLKIDGIPSKEVEWPPRPPGVYWDRTLKREVLDRLAKLERWAEQNPAAMDAEPPASLDALRLKYIEAEEVIAEVAKREELVVETLSAWSRERGLDEDVVLAVVRRMRVAGQLVGDYADNPLAGGWWHWYRLKGWVKNAAQDESRSRVDGGCSAPGDAAGGALERDAAGAAHDKPGEPRNGLDRAAFDIFF